MNEPIADAVRGILDGHIVLSRELAHRNHYPAIDVLAVRLARRRRDHRRRESRAAAGRLREVLATYRRKEDLITIGAYQPGSDPRTDYAIRKVDELNALPAPAAGLLRGGRDRRGPAAAMLAALGPEAFGDAGTNVLPAKAFTTFSRYPYCAKDGRFSFEERPF